MRAFLFLKAYAKSELRGQSLAAVSCDSLERQPPARWCLTQSREISAPLYSPGSGAAYKQATSPGCSTAGDVHHYPLALCLAVTTSSNLLTQNACLSVQQPFLSKRPWPTYAIKISNLHKPVLRGRNLTRRWL